MQFLWISTADKPMKIWLKSLAQERRVRKKWVILEFLFSEIRNISFERQKLSVYRNK